jgi:hypothetical protein
VNPANKLMVHTTSTTELLLPRGRRHTEERPRGVRSSRRTDQGQRTSVCQVALPRHAVRLSAPDLPAQLQPGSDPTTSRRSTTSCPQPTTPRPTT